MGLPLLFSEREKIVSAMPSFLRKKNNRGLSLFWSVLFCVPVLLFYFCRLHSVLVNPAFSIFFAIPSSPLICAAPRIAKIRVSFVA